MNGIINVTDAQAASVEQSLGQLRIADQSEEQHEAQADDLEEDMQGAEMAMEDELLTLKALRDMIADLKASIEAANFESSGEKSDDKPQPATSSVSVKFKGRNHGVQFGVNHAPIGGIHLGQPKQCNGNGEMETERTNGGI